jgi:ABC-type antimicrobial peptide transport system permease subunit
MRFQVGWHLSWKLSPWTIVEIFVVAQVVSFISVWWPMRSADKINPVEALQSD